MPPYSLGFIMKSLRISCQLFLYHTTQKAAEEATLLPNLLMKYMEIRKEERKDWTRAGQNRGTSQDLKAVSEALSYLRQGFQRRGRRRM